MVFNSKTDIAKAIAKMPISPNLVLSHDGRWSWDCPEIVVDSEINPSEDNVLCVDDPEMICNIKMFISLKSERAKEQAKNYQCPMCGYTHKDAMIHMDHYICEQKGGPKLPEITQEERKRIACEIFVEGNR